ncbi:MAG: 30S ribosome-binding factor RbfA [Alphaproteobacteria bacterium]|nr:30S ribosome-binding factor RbfA [Alphaproteobacteria bacterium]
MVTRRSGGSAPTQRQLRVGEELRHVLAAVLSRGELRDPALQDASITVTEVRVSPDLRNATAFVMPLGGAQAADMLPALRRAAPFLRGQVARAMDLRVVPQLDFTLDTSFDNAQRIDGLLRRPEVARDLDAAPPGGPDDDERR